MSALGTVEEVHGKLLVLGRGLGDLLGGSVGIGVADAGIFAEAGHAQAVPEGKEEGPRCGEDDVAWLLIR